MLTVAEIMTREPYTLGPDNTHGEAWLLMQDHHMRHIPVVSGGALVGMVSHRDLLAAGGARLAAGAASDAVGGSHGLQLASIMTSPVHTINENTSLRGAALHLQKHRIGCLPVLREGRLVGIVTDSDFVTIAIHLMELLEITEPEEDDLF